MSSHYDVLETHPTATQVDLRRAYHRAVKNAHPDTGGTAEAFARVQDAWAVLGQPERRAAYDDAHNAKQADRQTAPPPAARTAPGPINITEQPEVPDSTPPARGRQLLRRLCIAGAVISGGFTIWVITEMGRPFTAAAALYLATTGALALLQATGRHMGEGTYRRLVQSAWLLAAGLGTTALVAQTIHHSPWPPLIWSSCVAVFAASITGLVQRD